MVTPSERSSLGRHPESRVGPDGHPERAKRV